MTGALRLWLGLTRALPGLFRSASRRAHRRQGADPARFAERLGQPSHPRPEGPVLWFHAASLGEVAQIRDLALALASAQGAALLVTTTTQAGADWVARSLPEAIHQFCPLDTPAAVQGFLDHWRPMAGVFVESDLWPRLILACHAQGTPLILLNARASRTRARLPRSMAALLAPFRLVTCRTEAVAADLRALGLPAGRIHVTGDLKASAPPLKIDPMEAGLLASTIGARPVWIAASTHAGDEAAVLAAQATLAATPDRPLLIWAPRHPRRAGAIMAAARAQGLAVAQRSADQAITPEIAIYLADTMGELGTLFALSPVVFLGGSFGPEGGHNPFEPAQLGKAVLTGPHVRNFADAFAGMIEAGGALTVQDGDDLARTVGRLLQGKAAQAQGDRARSHAAGQGQALAASTALIGAALKGQ
jgi:3-deoxy-D-manno-octulosonic-acid transferase